MSYLPGAARAAFSIGIASISLICSTAVAQDIRYSWLDMSYMSSDVDRSGSQMPDPLQMVDINGSDGNGIRFRGSIGTWHNLYLFVDFGSTDIDLAGVVTNTMNGIQTPAQDEFDFTKVRGGVGLRVPVGRSTDIYGELSYDSADFDFGSFAGENFDTGEKDVGGAIGVRHMVNDDFEVRAWGRYTAVGDVDLNTFQFDTDTLFGVGFGWQIVRGFSIVGDFESGEFSNWNFGFRLDLDEN